MSDEMGYEPTLWIGTAGTTATVQVTQATDVDYDLGLDRGSTTVRGDGTSVPITTENATQRKVTITWSMINDPTVAHLLTILTAAKTGAGLAILLKTGSGVVLFDGDCTIAKKFNAPLNGESSYDFSATPTKKHGRSPTLG